MTAVAVQHAAHNTHTHGRTQSVNVSDITAHVPKPLKPWFHVKI